MSGGYPPSGRPDVMPPASGGYQPSGHPDGVPPSYPPPSGRPEMIPPSSRGYPPDETRQHQMARQQQYWMEMERRRQYMAYMQHRAARDRGQSPAIWEAGSEVTCLLPDYCSLTNGTEFKGHCPQ